MSTLLVALLAFCCGAVFAGIAVSAVIEWRHECMPHSARTCAKEREPA